MKKLNYLLSAAVLMMVLITVGCGKDDGPNQTPEEAVTEAFSKTWVLSSATLTGEGDVTDLDGLTLTVGNLSYSTNSGSVARTPNPWPSSGSWSFSSTITDANTSSFTVLRDDGLSISVTGFSDTAMTMGFTFSDSNTTGGKEEAVNGAWVMSFTAQ